jgi:hypothetical protein
MELDVVNLLLSTFVTRPYTFVAYSAIWLRLKETGTSEPLQTQPQYEATRGVRHLQRMKGFCHISSECGSNWKRVSLSQTLFSVADLL